MADFSMFNPKESGARLAEQDSVSNFLKIARGQHEAALADQAQQKAAAARAQEAAFSKLTTPDGTAGPGAGGSIADIADWQANQLIKLGQPQAALTLGKKAAEIRLDEARVGQVKGLQANQELASQVKTAESIAQLYSGVKDEKSWAAAGLMASQMFPGDKNLQGIVNMPYNPAYVERLTGLALKEKDRLHAEQEKIRTGIQQSNASSLNAVRNARLSLIDSQKQYLNARTENAIKNGGATGRNLAVGTPLPREQRDARDMVASQYPGLPDAELDLAGLQVASEAKALVKAAPGLDWNTALQRASAAAASDMATVRKIWGDDGHSFRNGATPAVAKPAVSGMKIVPGKYYTANGKIAVGMPDGKLREVKDGVSTVTAGDGPDAEPDDDGDE